MAAVDGHYPARVLASGTRYAFNEDGGQVDGSFVNYASSPPVTQPTVTLVSPSNGSTIDRDDAVTLEVSDVDGLSQVLIYLIDDNDVYEVLYDGTAFATNYASDSEANTIDGGFEFVLVRDGLGWRGDTLDLFVVVTDSMGTRLSPDANFSFNLTAETPLSITLVAPSNGTEIARDDTVTLDVEAAVDLAAVFIYLVQESGALELVYDNADFAPDFTDSTKTPIAEGLRFALTRSGRGWRGTNLTLEVSAVDLEGGTLTDEFAFPLEEEPPPAVTLVSPTNGSTIARTAAITVDVSALVDVATITIYNIFADASWELVYDGATETFSPEFNTSSKAVQGDGLRFTLRRDNQWQGTGVLLNITATLLTGDTTSLAPEFDLVYQQPAPTVTLVGISDGDPIDRDIAITVDITDPQGLAFVTLYTVPPSGVWELIYDGEAFAPDYSDSEISTIANGFRLVLRRNNGWKGHELVLKARGADLTGETA